MREEEEDEAAGFVGQRRNGSAKGIGLVNPLLKWTRTLSYDHTNGVLFSPESLLCHLMILRQRIIASWAILNDSLNPSQLVVTLTWKRVDYSIVIWEELNQRACVVDTSGASGRSYITAIRQDFPNALDPTMYSGSRRSDLFATRL